VCGGAGAGGFESIGFGALTLFHYWSSRRGRGWPEGGMTVRDCLRVPLRAYPHPNPSPGGRGASFFFLLPSGEGGLKGRMRVRTCANAQPARWIIPARAYPHPNPSSGARGAQDFSSPVGEWRECAGMLLARLISIVPT